MSESSESINIDEVVSIIMRQTDYTEKEATKQLVKFDYDAVKVVKHFWGIDVNKDGVEKKKEPIKYVGQEIYRQFRQKLQIPFSYSQPDLKKDNDNENDNTDNAKII